jgi:hypothetical protein
MTQISMTVVGLVRDDSGRHREVCPGVCPSHGYTLLWEAEYATDTSRCAACCISYARPLVRKLSDRTQSLDNGRGGGI